MATPLKLVPVRLARYRTAGTPPRAEARSHHPLSRAAVRGGERSREFPFRARSPDEAPRGQQLPGPPSSDGRRLRDRLSRHRRLAERGEDPAHAGKPPHRRHHCRTIPAAGGVFYRSHGAVAGAVGAGDQGHSGRGVPPSGWDLLDDCRERGRAEQAEILEWVRTRILGGGTAYRYYQSEVSRQRFGFRASGANPDPHRKIRCARSAKRSAKLD